MAQHIGLTRIDERGKILERSEVNFADFINVLYKLKKFEDKYPLISYIDPYGDTYFNIRQRSDLVEELKRFSLDNNLGDIEQLITFISKTGIHEYIKFTGD